MAEPCEKLGVHLVKPERVSSSLIHSLTNLDLINANPAYHEVVLFFEKCATPSHGESEVLRSLKLSLSKALSEFPVLAGRMTVREDGKAAVSIGSQGIHFIESRSNARLDDWEDLRQCPLDMNLSLEAGTLDISQAPPLLQIQATIFRCGGIALGFHFLHAIMDGFSLVHFLNSWSEIHRGQKIKVLPSFKPEIFQARSHPAVNSSPPFLVEETPQQDATCFEFDVPSEYETVVLRMDKEALDACVGEVENGKFSYGKPTSFEAVSAMLWSSITRARGISDVLDTAYMLPINLRGKYMNVPADYFGNALIPSQAYSKAAEVIMKDKSYAARLIHDRIKSCNSEGIRSAIDWLEVHSPAAIVGKLHWKRGILSTSLGRFPVYDMNFGWAGGPLSQICLLPSALPPAFVATFPAPPSTGKKSLDINIRLHHVHKNNLLSDPSFVKYFSLKELTIWANPLLRKVIKAM